MDNTTRRRVIQGAGIIGITGVVGVGAAQESPTPTAGETALRVTHASPDAPPVSVRLDDETVVESLDFGTVTDYQTVAPGTYQLQILTADGGGFLGGLLDDIFGSNQEGQTVLYDEEVTIEEGTTYTAVAYGEAGQGVAGTPTTTPTPDGGATTATPGTPIQELQAGGGQTDPLVEGLAFGESATATVPEGDYRLLVQPADGGEETAAPGDGATTPTPDDGATTPTPGDGATPMGASTPEGETQFQVEILEDDLSSPPESESRVRLFHAVPDVGPVDVIATQQGDAGQGQGGEESQLSADVTLEGGTVYSAFAVGYADPGAAAGATQTEASPAGTPQTEASPTGTPAGDRPSFELLVAETAADGERVQGGGT